jgi:hypothetical protein
VTRFNPLGPISLLAILGLCLPACADGVGIGGDDDDGADDDDVSDDDDVADDDDDDPITELSEEEPNDGWPYQDLGELAVGDNRIAGNAATAGHADDAAQSPNADLDIFKFTVPNTGSVTFTMLWDTRDDLDFVVYTGVAEASVLGFDSPEQIAIGATEAIPEETRVRLTEGVEYWALVGNWAGDPNIDYILEIDVP